MSNELSYVHLIMNASPVVQMVIGLLVFASVSSWTMIFDRMRVIRRAKRDAEEFENRFWSGGDLADLYRQIERSGDDDAGMAAIFRAGFREYARLRAKTTVEPMAVVHGAQRSMRVALSREMDDLETYLSTLATIGSTSPYVGLFGTVWGIMHSFTALGNVKQATLALVAPGIAEALIATAIGLFAAIPAVIAFNRYSNDVERLNNRYDDFLEEFSTILQRQAHG
jgi:biopolymer transport protein TolQ